MSKSEVIRSLVEEVRGILNLRREAEDTAAEDALHEEAVSEIVGEIFGEANQHTKAKADAAAADSAAKGKFKKKTLHNPFKRSPKIGPTKIPGINGRTVSKRGYWSCRCANYRCMCKGSEGERKRVVIGRAYKKVYNRKYRTWRAGAKKFTKGVWKKQTASDKKAAAK